MFAFVVLSDRLFHARAPLAGFVARDLVAVRPVGVSLPEDRRGLHAAAGRRHDARHAGHRAPRQRHAAADDLKARDALLRGFPEVESVIGKAGRADTPTDPAPLDMVETFVNFRPEGTLAEARAAITTTPPQQIERVLSRLESDGFVNAPPAEDDRENLINDASQKALERFDETMRELALLRYREFERDLARCLTRFAVDRKIDA